MPIFLDYANILKELFTVKDWIIFPICILILFIWRTTYIVNFEWMKAKHLRFRHYGVMCLLMPILLAIPPRSESSVVAFIIEYFLIGFPVFAIGVVGLVEMRMKISKYLLPFSFLAEIMSVPLLYIMAFVVSLFFDTAD